MSVVRVALVIGAHVVVVAILGNRFTVSQHFAGSDVAAVFCTRVSITTDGVIGAIQALVHKGTSCNRAAECGETTRWIFSGWCFYAGFAMNIFRPTSAGVTGHSFIATAVC